jgi:hypothetical protein
MKVKIKENQSVLDVVCQAFGTTETAFAFALLNEACQSATKYIRTTYSNYLQTA